MGGAPKTPKWDPIGFEPWHGKACREPRGKGRGAKGLKEDTKHEGTGDENLRDHGTKGPSHEGTKGP